MVCGCFLLQGIIPPRERRRSGAAFLGVTGVSFRATVLQVLTAHGLEKERRKV